MQEARGRLGGEERAGGGQCRPRRTAPWRAPPHRPRAGAHLGLWLVGSARGRHGGRKGPGTHSAHAWTLAGSLGKRARRRPWACLCSSWLLLGQCVAPSSPLPPTSARTHAQAFTRTGKAGLACAGGFVGPATPPPGWAVTTLLKEPGRRETAPSQSIYTKLRAQ